MRSELRIHPKSLPYLVRPIPNGAPRTIHSSFNYCTCNSNGDGVYPFFEDVELRLRNDATEAETNGDSSSSYVASSLSSSKWGNYPPRKAFIRKSIHDAQRVVDVLHRDGPGFDVKSGLDELQIRVSAILVREVLFLISKSLNPANRIRSAKLGYKFFIWSGKQNQYNHTTDSYGGMMKFFLKAREFKPVWTLLDEMIDRGFKINARTLNIILRASRESGLPRKIVEKFIKLRSLSFRPFEHSYNAILHTLLVMKEYKLIEWVDEQMLSESFKRDLLSYNVLLRAKYELRKHDEFHVLLRDMIADGIPPDCHTYTILLHVLGKDDRPLAAMNLLNHMRETGMEPSVVQFTALMDGLSRAGNADACNYFFNAMIENGTEPDVVCYTVMIGGYGVRGEMGKAEELLRRMVGRGKIPNVYTYNAMIGGLCRAGRFDEAYNLLSEMESRGCNPNLAVYRTLLRNLGDAGKRTEVRMVIAHMVERGKYDHLLHKHYTP